MISQTLNSFYFNKLMRLSKKSKKLGNSNYCKTKTFDLYETPIVIVQYLTANYLHVPV